MARIWDHLFVKKQWKWIKLPTTFRLSSSFVASHVAFCNEFHSHPWSTAPPPLSPPPSPSSCRDARLGTIRSSPLLRVSDGSFYWERVKWLRMSASVYIPQWCVPDEGAPLTRIRVSESTWSRHRKHSSSRYVPLKVSSNVPRCVCGLRHGSPVSFADGTGSAVSL